MRRKDFRGRYGSVACALVVGLLTPGCEMRTPHSEPETRTLRELHLLMDQPRAPGRPGPDSLEICKGAADPALCQFGGGVFESRCSECHGVQGVFERKGPSLVGLLGRTRSSLSGQSVVADEAYLRRKLMHHGSDSEYVPGWKGTTERMRAQRARPPWPEYARHRDQPRSEHHGVRPLVGDGLDGVVAFVTALSPEPGPEGSVRYRLDGLDDNSVESAIGHEIERRLESVLHCFAVATAGEETPALVEAPNREIVFRLNGQRDWKNTLVRPSEGNEFVLGCAADAMADVVAASPKTGLPSSDVQVTLTLLPDSLDRVGTGPWTPPVVARKHPFQPPKPPKPVSDVVEPEELAAFILEFAQRPKRVGIHPVCQQTDDPERCDDGADGFAQYCARCHGVGGVQRRLGPSLVGLVGRERTFLSGQSVVADEAYVTRAIADHFSLTEYVPGWKGTAERALATETGSTEWIEHVVHHEKSAWPYYPLDTGDLQKLVAFVTALSLYPGARGAGEVSYRLDGIEDTVASQHFRRQLEWRLDSIRDCYWEELSRHSKVKGAESLSGNFSFHLDETREPRPAIGGNPVRNPVVLQCIVDAVADAVDSSRSHGHAVRSGHLWIYLHDTESDPLSGWLRTQ